MIEGLRNNRDDRTGSLMLIGACCFVAICFCAFIAGGGDSASGQPAPTVPRDFSLSRAGDFVVIDQPPRRALFIRSGAISGIGVYNKHANPQTGTAFVVLIMGAKEFRFDVLNFETGLALAERLTDPTNIKQAQP